MVAVAAAAAAAAGTTGTINTQCIARHLLVRACAVQEAAGQRLRCGTHVHDTVVAAYCIDQYNTGTSTACVCYMQKGIPVMVVAGPAGGLVKAAVPAAAAGAQAAAATVCWLRIAWAVIWPQCKAWQRECSPWKLQPGAGLQFVEVWQQSLACAAGHEGRCCLMAGVPPVATHRRSPESVSAVSPANPTTLEQEAYCAGLAAH